MRDLGFIYGRKKMTEILISTILLFFSRFFPLPGLSVSASMVVWILIGAIIIWLSIDVTWTSLYVLLAIMLVPDLGVTYALQNSFANSTAILIVFCFLLSSGIVESGFVRRVAILMITNRFSRKNPWNCILMLFMSCFLLCLFLSSTAAIFVSIPLCEAIFKECRLEDQKYKKLCGISALMIYGTHIGGSLGNAATPISNAISIQGMDYFTQYTGNSISFFTLAAVLIPVSCTCIFAYWLICRFVWKPDVSALHNIDFDKLRASCGAMEQREKWSVFIYLTVVAFWLLPGILEIISPNGLYPYVSRIDRLYPAIIGVVLMHLLRMKDGKSVREYKDALAYVNWGTYIFLACIMCVGAAISNKDLGIANWLCELMTPVFGNVPAWLFVFAAVCVSVLMTNFASNMVCLALSMALVLPLGMGLYADSVNIVTLALLCITSVQHGIATPPSSPASAIISSTGWIDTSVMAKVGFVQAFINIILIYCVGNAMAFLIV